MPGIEPGAFHMQSERATSALYALLVTLADYTGFYSIMQEQCQYDNAS